MPADEVEALADVVDPPADVLEALEELDDADDVDVVAPPLELESPPPVLLESWSQPASTSGPAIQKINNEARMGASTRPLRRPSRRL